MVATIKGFTNSRTIKYWKERGEIYVGYKNGYMTVYKMDLEKLKGKVVVHPIYSNNSHSDDIASLLLFKSINAVATVGKDLAIRFWVPPANWKKDGSSASTTGTSTTDSPSKTIESPSLPQETIISFPPPPGGSPLPPVQPSQDSEAKPPVDHVLEENKQSASQDAKDDIKI